MAETKTKPTNVSVEDYITSKAKGQQLADCRELITMLKKITGESPKMWGPSIVGFGSYKYTYESGHSGESALTGFAIRGRDLVIYMMPEGEEKALLAKVGKYSMGKSCFYFRQLADLDRPTLEKIVAGSIAGLKKRYPA